MRIPILSMFVLALLTLSSCASSKQKGWLAEHSKQLTRAANDNRMSNMAKLDILGESLSKMMHQSLDFLNPQNGLAFAQSYADANTQNIEKIVNDLSPWVNNLNTMESFAFGAEVLSKDYAQDLVDLVPRFRRKYKQYAAVAKLLGKFDEFQDAIPGGLNF